ncbi:hypothetical protein WL77_12205 [Burkholderia ubonensis]|uniref:phage baseplate plug family protein n=1 Tax=Burkholderia ubonensis TaxID=101571 RepID=UPI00075394EB|nr:hypothetical protein [Burkholderia ubonensis]KWE70557.1 hypothetical protein WL77_12205 [Burkholderia ubonensis]KWE74902.1 hypothetical protein WL79_13895 [Burkholderia ubonensis]
MNVYEIPLSPQPQRFTVTLSGVDYRMTVQYRAAGGAGWVLDIADAGGTPLVNGIPLVAGVDLLAQHRHLGFAGRLWVQGAESPDHVPTFDDLGVGSKLYWVTD